MEFFKHNSTIDFMGARNWTAILSVLLFILSLTSLAMNGLQWGLDFTGGTQIEVSYEKPADLAVIRDELNKAGFPQAKVVLYGKTTDVLISIAPRDGEKQSKLETDVLKILPGATKQRVEFIGAQVGQELATKGALAIVVALLATMIYIAMRFEYRFAMSAAAALIHDPLLILGIFSYWHIDFDLNVLAAILAVIGYSLNDTIVVFDRVRENFRKIRGASVIEVMNMSINQTLSRTIMTSALTLIVVLALLLYGGESIHGFSLAFFIGIVIGTYSSIYVAGALAVALGLDRSDLMPVSHKEAEETP